MHGGIDQRKGDWQAKPCCLALAGPPFIAQPGQLCAAALCWRSKPTQYGLAMCSSILS